MLKQVSLSVKDESPFRELALRHDSKITVVECKDLDSRGIVFLLEVNGTDQHELLKDLQRIPGVRRVYWARNSARGALAMVTMDTPLFCEIVKSSGALCRSCPFNNTAGQECDWRLLVKDASVLKTCLKSLEEHGLQAQITDVSDAIRKDMLTQRQREIVQEAIRLGYFAFPRQIDLTQLANKLGVKPSTLGEILRRAEGKMAKFYLESNVADSTSLRYRANGS